VTAQLWALALLVLAALAWLRYAEHSTTRNLRAALIATLRAW
jgi:hypothetical protein